MFCWVLHIPKHIFHIPKRLSCSKTGSFRFTVFWGPRGRPCFTLLVKKKKNPQTLLCGSLRCLAVPAITVSANKQFFFFFCYLETAILHRHITTWKKNQSVMLLLDVGEKASKQTSDSSVLEDVDALTCSVPQQTGCVMFLLIELLLVLVSTLVKFYALLHLQLSCCYVTSVFKIKQLIQTVERSCIRCTKRFSLIQIR